MKYRIKPELFDKEWEVTPAGGLKSDEFDLWVAKGLLARLFEPVRPKLYARTWPYAPGFVAFDTEHEAVKLAREHRICVGDADREEFERICKAAFPDHEIVWVES